MSSAAPSQSDPCRHGAEKSRCGYLPTAGDGSQLDPAPTHAVCAALAADRLCTRSRPISTKPTLLASFFRESHAFLAYMILSMAFVPAKAAVTSVVL